MVRVMNRTIRAKPWSLAAGSTAAVLLLATAWVFRWPLRDIAMVGLRDEEQSHILLAPLLAVWLVALRRSRLRCIKVSPSMAGPGLLAFGVVLSWWGLQSDTFIAWHAGALLALGGAVVSVIGLAPLRHFAAAIGALAFLLPVPGAVRLWFAGSLQSISAEMTVACINLASSPFHPSGSWLDGGRVAGAVMLINGEPIAVAEACNGMRLVLALVLLVYGMAFSLPLRTGTRLLLVMLSPVVAVLGNIVRLAVTAAFVGAGSVEQAERFHHFSGWLMLPIALIALIGLLRMFRWLQLPVTSYRLAHP
jgi:exosortase